MDIDAAVVVALGGNLSGGGRSSAQVLADALSQFEPFGLHVLKRSSWWRSKAWPDASQPEYINGVALVETALSPEATLARLHEIEARFGRVRTIGDAARYVSRMLDLDLIAYGRTVVSSPHSSSLGLSLPHPRAAERGFVMGPLAEIAPAWRHPSTGRTARELAAEVTVGADATPMQDVPEA